MTFPTDPGRWTFTASGSSGSFNVNAPVFDSAALALYAVDSEGVIYAPAFTVSLATNRSGATVAVAAGLTSGHKVVVYRVPKLTQLEPLPASGPLPANLVGRQLDRAFADLVAMAVRSDRSIRAPLADNAGLTELPVAARRANGIVAFDAQGALTVVQLVTLSPAVPVSTFMQSFLLAADAAATRDTLGFSAWFQTLIGVADAAGLVAAIGAEDLRDTLDVERANAMSIQGLTWAKNGANTFDVAAGGVMSGDGARYIAYAGGTALEIETLFAAGGTLDTGAVGDADYWLHLVRNPTAGTVRVLSSLSRTAPTLPSGYTQSGLFGWIRRSAGALVAVNVHETAGGGVEIAWATRATDVSATVGTSRSDVALARVPLGLRLNVNLSVEFTGTNGVFLDVVNHDQADAAPASGGGIGVSGHSLAITMSGGGGFVQSYTSVIKSQHRVLTNTSGQVAMRATQASVAVKATVISFEWPRR